MKLIERLEFVFLAVAELLCECLSYDLDFRKHIWFSKKIIPYERKKYSLFEALHLKNDEEVIYHESMKISMSKTYFSNLNFIRFVI